MGIQGTRISGGPKNPETEETSEIGLGELNDIKILYTNADGLINKRHELYALLNSMENKPHIIAITEVKGKIIKNSVMLSELNLT